MNITEETEDFVNDIFSAIPPEIAFQEGKKYEKLFSESHCRKDAETAMYYYTIAADVNFPSSEVRKALHHIKEICERCSAVEAARTAFETGKKLSVQQMYLLGRNAYDGFLTPKNEKEGMLWIWDAAEHGLACAQFDLGEYYMTGLHFRKKNTEKGIKFIRTAAENGLVKAQVKLGMLYEKGRYISQDYQEAKKWYSMAAENGDFFSSSRLQEVEKHIRQKNQYYTGGVF